jgi:hypothetical protein
MQPRKWSPPTIEPSQAPPRPTRTRRHDRPAANDGALEYVVSFTYYMLFFGVIAGLLRSRFPIDLGMFSFFTSGRLMGVTEICLSQTCVPTGKAREPGARRGPRWSCRSF